MAAQREDGEKMQNKWSDLIRNSNVLTDETYSQFDIVQSFLVTLEEYKICVPKEADKWIRKKHAISTIRPLEDKLKQYKQSINKKDGEDAKKQWNNLKTKTEPLLEDPWQENYGEFDEVKRYIQDYNNESTTAEGTSKTLISEKQASMFYKKYQKNLVEMRSSISHKNHLEATRAWELVQQHANSLNDENFKNFDFAKKCLSEIKELITTIPKEIEYIKNYNDCITAISQIKPLMEKLRSSISKKQQSQSVKIQLELSEKASIILENTENHWKCYQEARNFTSEYRTLMTSFQDTYGFSPSTASPSPSLSTSQEKVTKLSSPTSATNTTPSSQTTKPKKSLFLLDDDEQISPTNLTTQKKEGFKYKRDLLDEEEEESPKKEKPSKKIDIEDDFDVDEEVNKLLAQSPTHKSNSVQSQGKYYSYMQLKLPESTLTESEIDFNCRENYLTNEEFEDIMEMNKEQFYKLPKWKQSSMKKDVFLS
eukprot:NODE_1508_length_1925_cov_32.754717_g1278_i0.p1 GENE.NODE_1508_length_1925_cov_32.754717_g1278_i0~~NODE_1508_length_1925_cov_32.754717_g1278_i0.p1  ORF type:complete len:481 (-),score=103.69 NODE_1508_length_1925_cov_32.754717_g1278_i0:144-1586(-)